MAKRMQASLDVFGIQAAKAELLELAAAPGDLELDLAEVADLDGSGAQLLLVLQRELAARGASLRLQGLRPEWRELLRVLGLGDLAPDTVAL